MPSKIENDIMFQHFVASGELTVFEDGKVLGRNGKSRGYVGDYGYVRIEVNHNGIRYNTKLHRLIYITFKGFTALHGQINHKNGIKTDNRLCNLEEVTASENGIHKASFSSPKPRLTDMERNEILKLYELGVRRAELSEMFDTSVVNVYSITRVSKMKFVQRNRKIVRHEYRAAA